MHIIYRKALRLLITICCISLYTQASSQVSIIVIEYDCMNLKSEQEETLKNYIQKLEKSELSIEHAFDSMKYYYVDNNFSDDCSFIVTCNDCRGTGFMYYPIKVAQKNSKSDLFATRSGKTIDTDIEKLYSNDLHIINNTTVDISPIHKVLASEKYFIEYTFNENTITKELSYNTNNGLLFDKKYIYGKIKETSISTIENKIYYIVNGKKRYLSPRMFKLNFFNDIEIQNLQKALKHYKKSKINTEDSVAINTIFIMLNQKYGQVTLKNVTDWYNKTN